jgi:hypothetical protein
MLNKDGHDIDGATDFFTWLVLWMAIPLNLWMLVVYLLG